MRARAASNSASLTRNAKCRGWKSVESEKSRVTPLPVLTGTKWPHSGPASRFKISARNLAETHLSCAALVQTARSDRLRWHAERAEVGNGQTEDCRRAVQGSPLRPRRRHPVRALVSSL